MIINYNNTNILEEDLEEYLIKLNKKVLIISKEKIEFSNYFLNRTEIISEIQTHSIAVKKIFGH